MPRVFRLIVFSTLLYTCTSLLCMHCAVMAQEPEVTNGYLLDRWDIEDGLPANNVVDLLQSKSGYLWLVTFNGLVRFDGLRMKIYQTDKYPTMPSNRINKIEESDDAILWLTTEQGYLVKFENEVFTRIDSNNGLNNDFVNTITKDRNGTIWFATDRGIVTYNNGIFQEVASELINIPVGKIYPLLNNELWFTNKDYTRVFRYKEDTLTHFDELLRNKIPMQSIVNSPNEEVFLAVGDSVFEVKNEQLKLHSVIRGNTINSAAIDFRSDGVMWGYTTSSGVFSYTNNTWVALPNSNHRGTIARDYFYEFNNDYWVITERAIWRNSVLVASIPNGIYNFLFDREGNLWVGTMADGIIRIKENPFQSFTTNDGLPSNNVYGIMEDFNQNIWVGTHGFGAATIKNDSVINTHKALSSSTGGYFKGLFQAKDSTIYAGTLGTSLLALEQGEVDFPYSDFEGEGVPVDINAFFEDSDGGLWAGGSNGLFRFSNGEWLSVNKNDSAVFGIKYFQPASDNETLWIATNGNGLWRYQNSSVQVYNTENGLPTDHIRSLYIKQNANTNAYTLWIGSQDVGLIRLEVLNNVPNLETVTTYSTSEGLADHTIHVMIEDDQGNLWMNTNQGIFSVSTQQLEDFHSGIINKIEGVRYTEVDGLSNREGNGGVQPAGIKASDGRIWMASQEGVVVFHPKNLINNTPPAVVIEEITSNERTILSSINGIQLKKNERNFEISFAALSLTSPEKNQYKYRLAGFNNEWQDADILRKASYTNVPNGQYTFEVIASNNSGVWSASPATQSITIQPYFYETTWFLFLAITFFGFVVYNFIQWRLSALRKNELQLKHLVSERTKELLEEKKITEAQTLRLQELDKVKSKLFANISHELKTPLTLIIGPLKKILSSVNSYDPAIQNELERMLRNSDRLLRLVDQTLEITKIEHGTIRLQIQPFELIPFIENLMSAFAEIAYNEGISLTLNTELNEDCATIYGDRDKLEIMVANLLSNAIKFTPENGTVTVHLYSGNDSYCIEVTDTGIGIPHSELELIFDRFYQVDSSETRKHEGTGIGLSLVKEFAQLHKGSVAVHSTLNHGSTFTVKVPKGFEHFTDTDIIRTPIPVTSETTVSSAKPSQNVSYQTEKLDAKKLLIVEDNPDLQQFLQEIFASSFQLITASNGEEALEKVSHELPDIIIADVMMPIMDGFTFNQLLKKDPETASIPLLFLTAKGQKDNELQGLADGADAYVTKPFDPDLLYSRIQNLLESRMRLRSFFNEQSTTNNNHEKETDPFLRKVNEQLSLHFSNPSFNVSELSNALFLDRSQVLRNLKASCGLSPSEYLKKYRIERAKEFLLNDEYNISEIAYASGFNSLSYFSYSFKEQTGQSPTEFLQSMQNA